MDKLIINRYMFKKYKVENNWLYENGKEVPEIKSHRNKFSAGNNICDYIVIHYTAGPSLRSAHNTFLRPESSVSWHLTIDRDGSIYQLYDFRKRCWHAGVSNWIRPNGKKTGGLNKWAIGIELIAGGPLTEKNGDYYGWWGRSVDNVYFDDNCKPWHKITRHQVKTCERIIPVLQKAYKCVDILGHSEISPGRKVDPGPQGMEDIVYPLRKKYFT